MHLLYLNFCSNIVDTQQRESSFFFEKLKYYSGNFLIFWLNYIFPFMTRSRKKFLFYKSAIILGYLFLFMVAVLVYFEYNFHKASYAGTFRVKLLRAASRLAQVKGRRSQAANYVTSDVPTTSGVQTTYRGKLRKAYKVLQALALACSQHSASLVVPKSL